MSTSAKHTRDQTKGPPDHPVVSLTLSVSFLSLSGSCRPEYFFFLFRLPNYCLLDGRCLEPVLAKQCVHRSLRSKIRDHFSECYRSMECWQRRHRSVAKVDSHRSSKSDATGWSPSCRRRRNSCSHSALGSDRAGRHLQSPPVYTPNKQAMPFLN